MAKKGRIYLFGSGSFRSNPIHGKDLAHACVEMIDRSTRELKIGGPQTLTQKEIALLAFAARGREPNITYLPDWLRQLILHTARLLTGPATYGPIEFFLTVLAMDMCAPKHGKITLKEHFTALKCAEVSEKV